MRNWAKHAPWAPVGTTADLTGAGTATTPANIYAVMLGASVAADAVVTFTDAEGVYATFTVIGGAQPIVYAIRPGDIVQASSGTAHILFVTH